MADIENANIDSTAEEHTSHQITTENDGCQTPGGAAADAGDDEKNIPETTSAENSQANCVEDAESGVKADKEVGKGEGEEGDEKDMDEGERLNDKSDEVRAEEGVGDEKVTNNEHDDLHDGEMDLNQKEVEKEANIPLMENHATDACNHQHEEAEGHAAHQVLIPQDSQNKELLQVPTRTSTKRKKRKDVHINLESTISDASKSSTDFSDYDRDQYNRRMEMLYERSSSCHNCRRSRACCIFIYIWVVIFVLCAGIALVIVAFKVLIPYLDALSFKETRCEGVKSTFADNSNGCSCGKSCKSEYPCVSIEVSYADQETQETFVALFSDNEASIGAKVSTVSCLRLKSKISRAKLTKTAGSDFRLCFFLLRSSV